MSHILRADWPTVSSPHLPPHSAVDRVPLPVDAPPQTVSPSRLQLHAPELAAELQELQAQELRQVAAERQAELARLREVARFD